MILLDPYAIIILICSSLPEIGTKHLQNAFTFEVINIKCPLTIENRQLCSASKWGTIREKKILCKRAARKETVRKTVCFGFSLLGTYQGKSIIFSHLPHTHTTTVSQSSLKLLLQRLWTGGGESICYSQSDLAKWGVKNKIFVLLGTGSVNIFKTSPALKDEAGLYTTCFCLTCPYSALHECHLNYPLTYRSKLLDGSHVKRPLVRIAPCI